MAFAAPERDDDDDPARVRRAVIQAAARKAEALGHIPKRGTYEYDFLRRDPAGFDDHDLALIERLAWHYRRRIPAHHRPSHNPDDPIIRERLLSRV